MAPYGKGKDPGQQECWPEQNFQKLECAHFVASADSVSQCQCGELRDSHAILEEAGEEKAHQSVTTSPTDAFGTIDFLSNSHSNKANYIRLAYDSQPDLITQLLTEEWGLRPPKLVVSIHGGKANFKLNQELQCALNEGILGVAKTTSKFTQLYLYYSCTHLMTKCLQVFGF